MYKQLSTFRDLEPSRDIQSNNHKPSYLKKLMEREKLLRGFFGAKTGVLSNSKKSLSIRS